MAFFILHFSFFINNYLTLLTEHLWLVSGYKIEFQILKKKIIKMNYLGFKKDEVAITSTALNGLLANYHIYYQNLRNFHWNVNGENFFDLHALFEELYNDARLKIDEIAERILTLRMRPITRLADYLQYARIEEAGVIEDDRQMVEVVLEDHRVLIENMREVLEAANNIGDEGTIDLIAGFLADIEKKSWMLDAWRTKKEKIIAASH